MSASCLENSGKSLLQSPRDADEGHAEKDDTEVLKNTSFVRSKYILEHVDVDDRELYSVVDEFFTGSDSATLSKLSTKVLMTCICERIVACVAVRRPLEHVFESCRLLLHLLHKRPTLAKSDVITAIEEVLRGTIDLLVQHEGGTPSDVSIRWLDACASASDVHQLYNTLSENSQQHSLIALMHCMAALAVVCSTSSGVKLVVRTSPPLLSYLLFLVDCELYLRGGFAAFMSRWAATCLKNVLIVVPAALPERALPHLMESLVAHLHLLGLNIVSRGVAVAAIDVSMLICMLETICAAMQTPQGLLCATQTVVDDVDTKGGMSLVDEVVALLDELRSCSRASSLEVLVARCWAVIQLSSEVEDAAVVAYSRGFCSVVSSYLNGSCLNLTENACGHLLAYISAVMSHPQLAEELLSMDLMSNLLHRVGKPKIADEGHSSGAGTMGNKSTRLSQVETPATFDIEFAVADCDASVYALTVLVQLIESDPHHLTAVPKFAACDGFGTMMSSIMLMDSSESLQLALRAVSAAALRVDDVHTLRRYLRDVRPSDLTALLCRIATAARLTSIDGGEAISACGHSPTDHVIPVQYSIAARNRGLMETWSYALQLVVQWVAACASAADFWSIVESGFVKALACIVQATGLPQSDERFGPATQRLAASALLNAFSFCNEPTLLARTIVASLGGMTKFKDLYSRDGITSEAYVLLHRVSTVLKVAADMQRAEVTSVRDRSVEVKELTMR